MTYLGVGIQYVYRFYALYGPAKNTIKIEVSEVQFKPEVHRRPWDKRKQPDYKIHVKIINNSSDDVYIYNSSGFGIEWFLKIQ